MAQVVEFKRMMLGLPHSARDYASVVLAAELANLMGIDLIGVFAEDDTLAELASLPCVRELRIANDGWHRLDVQQSGRLSAQLTAEARRLFSESVKALQVAARFDLAKGTLGEAIGLQSTADDIVVVIEPSNPAERVTYQFKQLRDMAMTASAAALLVPSRIRHRRGPVVAIATGENDPSIAIGLRIARSVDDRLLVIAPRGAHERLLHGEATTHRVAVDHYAVGQGQLEVSEISSVLALIRERLVVMSRSASPELPEQLSFERGVPVLVVNRN